MNRRLNPELFNKTSESNDVQPSGPSMVATRELEKELKSAKKRISHLESLLEVVQSQIRITSENTDKRTQVFSKAISELEKDIREQGLENSRRMQNIEGRMRDQKVVEGQVENMVDRFNMNLMQFENKLSSLQKVISEKEMTLMSYRRIIEQIVDEVEKLKNPRNASRRPLDL